jgi:very-short-patch-repair endonuclease
MIIDGKRHVINKRIYCLECSPFKCHNTLKLNGLPRKIRCNSRHDQLDKAAQLYKNGDSLRIVAKKTGVSWSTIAAWVRKGLIPHRNAKEAMKLAISMGRMRGSADWGDESRGKQRRNMLRRIAENPMNHPNRKLANNRKKMSYPERLVYDSLTAAGVDFEHGKQVGIYFPDFIIGKRIFEVDGARWHDSIKDAIRDKNLVALGYTVERIPAREVLKNPNIILDRSRVS